MVDFAEIHIRSEIYELATLHNKSYEEIAEAFGISEDEVEQIVLSYTTPKAQ